MTMVVRELPPTDSWRMRVSLLSRYGMCCLFVPSVRVMMTRPSAERDLLMFLASSRTEPSAPVLETFSEPARSTRYSLPVLTPPLTVSFCVISMRKTEWDLELMSFMLVEATERLSDPARITSMTSSGVCM